MKNVIKQTLWMVALVAMVFTSCKEENVEKIDAGEVLRTYLVAQNMDLDHIIKYHDDATNTDIKFVAAPPATDADVAGFLSKYYVIDIREAQHFAAGHIQDAHNTPLANILAEAEKAGDKRILVVCYTGQTACFATSLLRLYGYHDAQALKWGMSGWNASYATPWNDNSKNDADGHTNWKYAAAPANMVYDFPAISSNMTDGASILKERVEIVLAAGFKGTTAKNVLDNPGDYNINNYYSETDYTGFGHIDQAYRINPLLLQDNSMKGLNPDPSATVITYCYTGQTSAVITAYLRVLGYNASSLKFGMNGLWNDNPAWTSNRWSSAVPKNLSTVTD
jgi:rhodanese-related sulfurtransferase